MMAKDHQPIRFGPKPIVCLLLLGLTLISGCFDNEDIDRRMIVSAMGIDADADANADGKIRVTFKMPLDLPGGNQLPANTGSEKNFILRSSLTTGLFPAIIDIQSRNDLGIFIGQCRSIVFGEALAKRGVNPFLDFFTRMPTFSPNTFVVVARPSAAALLKVEWPAPEIGQQHMKSFFSTQANQGYGIKEWMLFRNTHDPLQDPMVPIVSPSDGNSAIQLTGLAAFRGDRMVGELDYEESVLWAMLRNLKKANRLVIPSSGSIPISFQVATGNARLKVAYPEYPLFKLELKIHAFLGELGGYQLPLDLRSLHKIENASTLYLKKKYLALFYKLQTLQCDPLDLGNNFRIQQSKHFLIAKWPEQYKHARFQVKVRVFIERLGVLK
jgi:Ger(x)C family germination protein